MVYTLIVFCHLCLCDGYCRREGNMKCMTSSMYIHVFSVNVVVYVCTVQHINVGVCKEDIFFTVAQYSRGGHPLFFFRSAVRYSAIQKP